MSKFINMKSAYTIFIRKSQDIEIGRLYDSIKCYLRGKSVKFSAEI